MAIKSVIFLNFMPIPMYKYVTNKTLKLAFMALLPYALSKISHIKSSCSISSFYTPNNVNTCLKF